MVFVLVIVFWLNFFTSKRKGVADDINGCVFGGNGPSHHI
jgi:hypothetical protein